MVAPGATQHAIPAVVNKVMDDVSTTLESCQLLFKGQEVAVVGSVVGALLLSAANLALAAHIAPEEFKDIADQYMRHVVKERVAQAGKRE